MGSDGTQQNQAVLSQASETGAEVQAKNGGASFSYDLAGNRLRIETTGGASQDFEYDAAGNIIGIVDGNHNRTSYQLDKWGRITQVLGPDGSIEFYTYDYAGNMTSSTDGEGHTTQYEYNRAGLMSKLIAPLCEMETTTVASIMRYKAKNKSYIAEDILSIFTVINYPIDNCCYIDNSSMHEVLEYAHPL